MLTESRILIVDDNRDLLEDWAEILEGEGAHVQTASSGTEGLELSRNPFDVALVDVRLPDMKGTSMVPQLKRANPESEVLLITGHGSVENAIEAVRTDAYDYLLKPVAPGQLLSRVNRACEHVSAKRESGELRDELNRESLFNESLIETAQAIILVLDVEGCIVKFNPYMEELSGYRVGEIRGKDWFETFVPPREHESVRAVFRDAVAGKTVRGNVNSVLTKSGEERIIDWSARILTDLDGSPAGVLSTGIDITERRRAEIELRHAQKMEAVGTLASGVAHDFNNVLMGILGCVDMAFRAIDAQDGASVYLKEVRAAAASGVSIARQLLAFARKESNEAPSVRVEPDQLLEDMQGLIRRLVGDHVEVELQTAAPNLTIELGAGQLEQILLNLVVNARQAMPGGGTLAIATEPALVEEAAAARTPRLAPGQYVVVAVRDTGSGIPDDIRHRVFDPFFTTKRPGEGTGLGLSTTFGIVQRAGGAIELESEVGLGTTFRIYLPSMGAPIPARSADESEKTHEGHWPPVSASVASLLIVEDQSAARLAMKDGLEDQGHTVFDAKTAAEALELFARHAAEIRVVLTDVGLPDMRGTELVRRLRARAPSLRVIYITAADDPSLEGLVDARTILLPKPTSLDGIETAVAKMLASLDAPEASRGIG